jgi:hypothetical protein
MTNHAPHQCQEPKLAHPSGANVQHSAQEVQRFDDKIRLLPPIIRVREHASFTAPHAQNAGARSGPLALRRAKFFVGGYAHAFCGKLLEPRPLDLTGDLLWLGAIERPMDLSVGKVRVASSPLTLIGEATPWPPIRLMRAPVCAQRLLNCLRQIF